MKRLNEIAVICPEPVKLRGGAVSNYYIDIKKAYGYPDIMTMLVEEIWNMMQRVPNCVAGMGHGGIPLAVGLGLKYGLKVTLVRDKEKAHGGLGKLMGMSLLRTIILLWLMTWQPLEEV